MFELKPFAPRRKGSVLKRSVSAKKRRRVAEVPGSQRIKGNTKIDRCKRSSPECLHSGSMLCLSQRWWFCDYDQIHNQFQVVELKLSAGRKRSSASKRRRGSASKRRHVCRRRDVLHGRKKGEIWYCWTTMKHVEWFLRIYWLPFCFFTIILMHFAKCQKCFNVWFRSWHGLPEGFSHQFRGYVDLNS